MHRASSGRWPLVVWLLSPLGGCATPQIWVERTETLSVPAESISQLSVETGNGDVVCVGEEGRSDLTATVRIRAGGSTIDSANRALAAVEIVSEAEPGGEHRFAWQWLETRRLDWGATVHFTLTVPADIGAQVETHNGDVKVTGLHGACTLHSHNGDIVARVGAAPLYVSTHNGDVTAEASGPEITLESHNGDIRLDAALAATLGGAIETHNGSIHARFGENTSAELVCDTHNGRVESEIPWRVRRISRSHAEGSLGEGGREFRVESFNGSIVLAK